VKAFAYVNAANEKEAVAALKTDGIAMLIGGGQDLLARMKDYIDSPDRVVNAKGLDATVAAMPGGGLKIGSAVKIIDLFENAQVAKLYPAVVHAAGEVGTPQIRHQGTVGGNVNQRPRCWYYRNEEFVCFKKGGSRCFAVNGENQYHAIFGNEAPATSSTRRASRCLSWRTARSSASSARTASVKLRRRTTLRCRLCRTC
jgi:xanthine dehydrogenase YagS FAD-binding subunit